MVAFTIHNIGAFMSKLFSTECFDSFLLEEAVIRMAVTYTVDGHLNTDFGHSDATDGESDPEHRFFMFETWSRARLICREMIKGRQAPSFLRLTLRLKPDQMHRILETAPDLQPGTLEAVSAFALNIRLDAGRLTLITGTASNTFLMDKSPDRVWDQTMERFLASRGFDFVRE